MRLNRLSFLALTTFTAVSILAFTRAGSASEVKDVAHFRLALRLLTEEHISELLGEINAGYSGGESNSGPIARLVNAELKVVNQALGSGIAHLSSEPETSRIRTSLSWISKSLEKVSVGLTRLYGHPEDGAQTLKTFSVRFKQFNSLGPNGIYPEAPDQTFEEQVGFITSLGVTQNALSLLSSHLDLAFYGHSYAHPETYAKIANQELKQINHGLSLGLMNQGDAELREEIYDSLKAIQKNLEHTALGFTSTFGHPEDGSKTLAAFSSGTQAYFESHNRWPSCDRPLAKKRIKAKS